MAVTTPSSEGTLKLLQDLEQQFPSQTIGEDRWYILAIAAISTGGHPALSADLYKYLISKPQFKTSESRKALVKKLREALFKLVSVVGVPKPLEAIFSMAEIENEEDKDYSFSKEDWKSGPENRARGVGWMEQIYKQDLATPKGPLTAHKDFMWLSEEITYGLYLSDQTILDGVDTELVVLVGIMMQNLARETGWHLRGMRRVGASSEDVETIQQCVEKVARFCGLNLNRVPRVKDIEHEV